MREPVVPIIATSARYDGGHRDHGFRFRSVAFNNAEPMTPACSDIDAAAVGVHPR